MEPLPASAEALELLAVSGDEDLGARAAWVAETLAEVVPQADAVAIWFADEDLTLVLVDPLAEVSRRVVDPVMRSSLALRLATSTRVISVVTIYSERVDVFAGRVSAVERAVGAVWGASVVDGDLAFDALQSAELAPAQLRARLVIDTAVGLLVGTRGLSIDEAEDWLDHVSRTGGHTALEVATQVLAARSWPDGA
ncbi:ANTAR domain-containing protein [Nocardioides cavernae]|uniref:ANTAR domain-containing protein n=1 Tax=Nocardioides cavernae TaxID=1921566 RepID=A0ABR8N8J8_9ACTN|nr:ANTAR domain-containing protein [Nocardioides cavernae]MBD3924462.1 ANTAR domain-containing protein [Nocardioides cavernae]MBM7510592.1 hypothetical protein [Nocardioides cavernae]